MPLLPRKHLLGQAALALALAPGLLSFDLAPTAPPALPPGPPPERHSLASFELVDDGLSVEDCLGVGPCEDARTVLLDLRSFDMPWGGGAELITYDYAEVTRALTKAELLDEGELSLAVRLILSEVGADRLLVNRFGVLEAIGILYTVDNRLDPLAYNPEDRENAPLYPGCGPGGGFASCANAQQYLGMDTWRALNPSVRYNEALLVQATDLAVLAWVVQQRGLIEDFTEGATSYVHRCGDLGYGLPTWSCDGHMGARARDVKGANPFTGPLVFKAPAGWSIRRGLYELHESRHVDFDPRWDDLDHAPWDTLGYGPGDSLRREAGDGVVDLGDEVEAALDPDVVRALRGMR